MALKLFSIFFTDMSCANAAKQQARTRFVASAHICAEIPTEKFRWGDYLYEGKHTELLLMHVKVT